KRSRPFIRVLSEFWKSPKTAWLTGFDVMETLHIVCLKKKFFGVLFKSCAKELTTERGEKNGR
ncbi:MAG: hypothetical protein K6F00_02775, partial [Lachnospiraceae bacterium]|nr:hypothetical protein [Lachnospiraceae bacterium]